MQLTRATSKDAALNRNKDYEVWDLDSRNLCSLFATEQLAMSAAKELSELNPGVPYAVDCAPSDEHLEHLGMYVNGLFLRR